MPSEELLSRFQEEFLHRVLAFRPTFVGYVGLLDGVRGRCSYRTEQFGAWLECSGVRALPAMFEVFPEWRVLGRALQACRVKGAVPGSINVALAKRFGASVIVGDTGRLGIGRLRITSDDGETVHVGVEAGALTVDSGDGKFDRRKRSELGVAVVTIDRRGCVEARCVGL